MKLNSNKEALKIPLVHFSLSDADMGKFILFGMVSASGVFLLGLAHHANNFASGVQVQNNS